MTTATEKMGPRAFYQPLPFFIAPNACSPDYANTHDFFKFIAYGVGLVSWEWYPEDIYDKPGFINFIKWLQLDVIEHAESMIGILESPETQEELREITANSGKKNAQNVIQIDGEYDGHQEWGNESSCGKDTKHPYIYSISSEFMESADPDCLFSWAMVMREQSGDDIAIWYQPWLPYRKIYWSNVIRDMSRKLRKAKRMLTKFWKEYEALYPLSESPEEWNS